MKKHYNFLTILLVVSLLVCSLFAVSVPAAAETATGAESALEIEYSNVAYNAMTQLAFTLKGTVAEGMEAGIAVWNPDVTGEKTLANASYTNFEYGTLQGKTYWLTKGIPASEMSLKLTVAPVVRNAETKEGVALAGPLFEHSIYDYVADRLDDDNVSEKQMKLYTNLVKYGNYAEKVINGSVRMPIVIANGGEIGKAGASLAFANAGGNALLRANAMNADGDYFLYWTDAAGNRDYSRVHSVSVSESTAVYNAVYGAKADSAYAGTLNISSLPAGQLSIVPSTIGTPTLSGGIYTVGNSASFLSGALELFYGKIQVVSDTDLTVVKTTELKVNEENGTKYLSFNKNGLGGTQYFSVTDKSGITNERLEVDMAYTAWSDNETTALYFYFNSLDTGRRIDVRYESNGDLYFFKNGTSVKVYGGNYKLGEKFTVSAEVNDNGYVVISVDGVAVTKAKDGTVLLENGGFDFGLAAGTTYQARKLWYESYSYDNNIANFYNVNFVDTDKLN